VKRLLATCLLCLYLFPAIGFSINVHWCCNKLSAVSFGVLPADNCKSCKKAGKAKKSCSRDQLSKKCCRTAQIAIQIKDNQLGASAKEIRDRSVVQLSSLFQTQPYLSSAPKKSFDFNHYHAPPSKGKQPVYLTICVFRV
jgi:hypothetical protein